MGRSWIGLACLFAAACGSSSSTSPSTTTPALLSVSVASTTVVAGSPVTGTIALSAVAPSNGIAVTMTSNSAAATVPATVTVQSGSSTTTFEIDTVDTPTPASVTITAVYSGATMTAAFTVSRPTLQTVTTSPASVVGGNAVTGTVTLSLPAPPQGSVVTLTSSSANATVPSSVTIPAGATTQTFEVDTADSFATQATITATYSGVSRTTVLTIGRESIQSLLIGIPSVPGGLTLPAILTMSVAAPPAGATVQLSSSAAVVSVPATVTVPAGEATVTFPITTIDAPPTTTATITASYGGTTGTASVTVIAYPIVADVSCTPGTVAGGASVQCGGTLAAPAPAGGWTLSLSSSDPSATVPASVSVPAGGTTFAFAASTTAVTSAVVVNLQVSDSVSGLPLFRISITVSP